MDDLGRLRWQCRRGMLELDLLLRRFVDTGYEALPSAEREAFGRLLDYPDDTLLELLMGRMTSTEGVITRVIQKIRAAQH
jgi:antitoxin CptB